MPALDPRYVSELYSAYASGRLSPAYALLVETQAALRADIRQDVLHAEAIAGAMLEAEAGEPVAPNAFEKVLQAIDRLDETEDLAVAAAARASDSLSELLALPEPVREHALEAVRTSGWRRLTGGVSRLRLSHNPAVRAHLYRIRPGATVPVHSHRGEELTLVLTGGFSDQGNRYGPGDLCRQTVRDTHKPVADEDEVCFALTVSEGGMTFKGLLGLIQKIAGQ